ncbi:MAG: B12-binding domain-containing radical SAM protein [Thermoplasmatota archaeon]
MKILMIYPKYPNTFWSFKYAVKYVNKKASFPPLGLLTVSSLLPDHFKIKLIDMNVEKLKEKDIEWADMVFISAMEVQKESVKEVVMRCKSKGKKIVAGGPLFTTQPNLIEGIDHLVLDEAEITLPPFIRDLNLGEMKKVYTSKVRPDINNVPIPSWTLINPNKYTTMLIQYSRGCPFNCDFCDISFLNGRIPRTKSPDQIIQELDRLFEMGWRKSVFFVDDNFIGNKKEVKLMLPRLIRWQKEHGYPFTFLTEASMDLADDELLMDWMVEANFTKVFLGIETPNMESLRECNKVQNVARDLVESVRSIQKRGMEVMGGFIVGFDNDTESIFQSQIDFIQETGIVTAMVGLLNAIPETTLWKRLKMENRLHGESSGSNTDGTINFIPAMEIDRLKDGYKHIISTIYSPREYYKRIDTFLKYYRPKSKVKFQYEYLRAFIQSLWRIGILSNSRFFYWKLLIKTLLIRKKSFPRAIELAITGHHLQKVTRIVVKS